MRREHEVARPEGTDHRKEAWADVSDTRGMLIHPVNAALLTYWQMVRDGDALPAWSNADPVDLGELLATAALLEWVSPQGAMVRFVGSDLVRWLGQDPTGRMVDSLPSPHGLGLQAPLILLDGFTAAGRPVTIEHLGLPFTDDQGAVRYMLCGCQWMAGAFAEGPQTDHLDLARFTTTRHILLPLEEDNL